MQYEASRANAPVAYVQYDEGASLEDNDVLRRRNRFNGDEMFRQRKLLYVVRAEHVRSLVNHANNLKVPRKAPVELLRLTLRPVISLSPTLK